MGGGYSGQGGGKRDNRPWVSMATPIGNGVKTIDGYKILESDAAIFETFGVGNGGSGDRWGKSLTPEELSAVNWYWGHGVVAINNLERHNIVEGNWYTADQALEGTMKLESALNKGGLDQDIIVTRTSGPELLGGATSVSEIRKKFGTVVTDKGYTSTEVNPHTSEINPYGRRHGENRITYHIKVEKGKGIGQLIRGVTRSTQEQEFLFNRGSTFKILGAYTDADGMTHVNLKYVGRHGKIDSRRGGSIRKSVSGGSR